MATDLALDETDLAVEAIDFPIEVLTLEQFLRIPEIKPALEFINGRIEQKMSPNLQHARIGQKLPALINTITEDAKLGLAFVEGRCSFDRESYVPDITYFRWDRIPLDAEGKLLERVAHPPDWSIEILSPGQTVAKVTARLERLVKKGVSLGWLIQPRKSRVFIVRPSQPVRILMVGDILDADPVLPGFALPVEELFGWLVIR